MDAKSSAERIFAVIRAIPRGQVAGYGEVAARAGLPGRARLVAKVLSGNTDAGLPWHRVLRADGRIAFTPGTDGFDLQCKRLHADGVVVVKGRVRGLAAVTSVDQQLWGPPPG